MLYLSFSFWRVTAFGEGIALDFQSHVQFQVMTNLLPVAELSVLSLQHGAVLAAVGTAAVQHWHVCFSHDAVADSGPQIFYLNNLVFSFIHQDLVLLV